MITNMEKTISPMVNFGDLRYRGRFPHGLYTGVGIYKLDIRILQACSLSLLFTTSINKNPACLSVVRHHDPLT